MLGPTRVTSVPLARPLTKRRGAQTPATPGRTFSPARLTVGHTVIKHTFHKTQVRRRVRAKRGQSDEKSDCCECGVSERVRIWSEVRCTRPERVRRAGSSDVLDIVHISRVCNSVSRSSFPSFSLVTAFPHIFLDFSPSSAHHNRVKSLTLIVVGDSE